MITKELTKILFLDLETVSISNTYSELPTRMKEVWEKKMSYYLEKENKTAEEAYVTRAGIFAEFGKIVVISVGYFYEKEGQLNFRVKALASDDETKLLKEFSEIVRSGFTRFCAHNGKEFDFPYLSRRYLIKGLNIPPLLNMQGKKPWQVLHYDTLELWKFGDYKNYTSLDTLCAVFDIESSKSDMDGSMVSKVYHEDQDLNRIAQYCNQDVVATAQVFLRLNEMKVLPKDRVEEVALEVVTSEMHSSK